MGAWSGENPDFLIVTGKGEEGSMGKKEAGKNRGFKGNDIVMGSDGSIRVVVEKGKKRGFDGSIDRESQSETSLQLLFFSD